MNTARPAQQEIDVLFARLFKEAEQSGYHLNPDEEFTRELVKGLLINQKRYGYQACPCRLSKGKRSVDLDIICPCDYRDPDLTEYGNCFCKLYVSSAVVRGEIKARSIPERRQKRDGTMEEKKQEAKKTSVGFSSTVWRCKVCGYLCARENPPEVCPICKASKDRFEVFT